MRDYTLSSREVAEMVDKIHSDLLKDIRRYVGQLAEGNIPLGDFFLESTQEEFFHTFKKENRMFLKFRY